MDIKSYIRTIPDYPKEGIMFRDITSLLQNATGLKLAINQLTERYKNFQIDKVVGIEARGFIIGTPLAINLGVGFVPIRKKGKLPYTTISEEYELEYGTDQIEIHTDAINKGERILLVDDLIATGGTAEAAIKLITKMDGEIVENCFIIDLPDIGGRKKLESMNQKVFTLCEFDGE